MALTVVQARLSSRRLPGKVLMDVEGEPMLALLLRRLMRSRTTERLILATSDRPEDAAVADVATALGAEAVMGPLEDVLGRFALAVGAFEGTVVRITADCPLIDPTVVDAVVSLHECSTTGYTSNVEPRTYPDGLDCEAFDAGLLRELAASTHDPAEREHVTLGLRRRLPADRVAALVGDEDLADLRWTVDEPDDLAFVRAVVRHLGPRRHVAGLAELVAAARVCGDRRATGRG